MGRRSALPAWRRRKARREIVRHLTQRREIARAAHIPMTKHKHRRLLALSTLVALAAVALGQDRPSASPPISEVKGKVTDTKGAVIIHAEVVFQSGSDTITTQTGQDGSIDLTLPSGTYVVTIAESGFKIIKIIDFQVHAPALAVLNVVLQVRDPQIIIDPPCCPEVPTTDSDLPNKLIDPRFAGEIHGVVISTDGLPAFSKGWTNPEKAQFQDCVSRISDRSRENTLQLSTDSYACMIFEEQQHWIDLHPEALGRREDNVKSRKCFDKHPLQIEGTPEEFHASFDLCMCKAYGLPKPKRSSQAYYE
jgi:hypothetical protein